MKGLLTSALLLLSIAGTAQTKTGINIIATAGTNDFVTSPTVGNFGGELQLSGRYAGLSATVESDSKFQNYTAVGAKLYVTVARFENMKLDWSAAAAKFVDKPARKKGDYTFRSEAYLSIPMTGDLDGRVGIGAIAQKFYFKKGPADWYICPTLNFSLAYNLFGNGK